jgi:hypothetical protein
MPTAKVIVLKKISNTEFNRGLRLVSLGYRHLFEGAGKRKQIGNIEPSHQFFSFKFEHQNCCNDLKEVNAFLRMVLMHFKAQVLKFELKTSSGFCIFWHVVDSVDSSQM